MNTDHRFEVLSARSMKQTADTNIKSKGVSKSQDAGEVNPTKTVVAGNNYAALYRQKSAAIRKNQEAEAHAVAAAKERARTSGKETLQETQTRGRAAQLFNEIWGWKSKIGTGEFDEATIQSNISCLETEFYGIDEKYRPR